MNKNDYLFFLLGISLELHIWPLILSAAIATLIHLLDGFNVEPNSRSLTDFVSAFPESQDKLPLAFGYPVKQKIAIWVISAKCWQTIRARLPE